MVVVESLVKQFCKPNGDLIAAVDGVSFTAQPGEIVGLLGPNGAGKTTTLRILCTLLKPTTGHASINGFDVLTHADQVRRQIGFVSASTGIYDRMTAREMIEYYGKMHGLSGTALFHRVQELFETLAMNDIADLPCGKMSTGQKQKVSIARALIHDPPVLIFDEPTNGLDVLIQRVVLKQVMQLKERGKCILYSTHIFREVEKVCDRVAIIHQGRVLENNTLSQLREKYAENDLEEIFFTLVHE
jgi:sodium transport system ATP-binding protein